MKYNLQFLGHDGWEPAMELRYAGDVYIEVFNRHSEDFALEVLFWAENAKPGDKYETWCLKLTVL